MPTVVFESRIAAPVEALWEFHRSVEALRLLTPPDRKVEILSKDLAVEEGAIHELRVRVKGLPMIWRARIHDVNPPNGFTDTAERSPFASWTHRHAFLADGEGSILRDTVTYVAPGGPLAGLVDRFLVAPDIEALFAFRHARTREALEAKP